MTQLEELLYALTTVIVRYADTQLTKKIVPDTDPKILRDKYRSYCNSVSLVGLSSLIQKTGAKNRDRLTLLEYLFNEIKLIKSMLDQKDPDDQHLFNTCKNEIGALFVNLKGLLLTTQNNQLRITYTSADDASTIMKQISGLAQNRIVGSCLCTSGELVKKEVFAVIGLSTLFSDVELLEKAERICLQQQDNLVLQGAHQANLLLSEELREAKNQLSESKNLLSQYQATQITTAELANTKVLNLTHELEGTLKKKSKLEQTIAEQDQTIKEQRDIINQLKENISSTTRPTNNQHPKQSAISPLIRKTSGGVYSSNQHSIWSGIPYIPADQNKNPPQKNNEFEFDSYYDNGHR